MDDKKPQLETNMEISKMEFIDRHGFEKSN
jgi:hypothetical protein